MFKLTAFPFLLSGFLPWKFQMDLLEYDLIGKAHFFLPASKTRQSKKFPNSLDLGSFPCSDSYFSLTTGFISSVPDHVKNFDFCRGGSSSTVYHYHRISKLLISWKVQKLLVAWIFPGIQFFFLHKVSFRLLQEDINLKFWKCAEIIEGILFVLIPAWTFWKSKGFKNLKNFIYLNVHCQKFP